MNSIGIKILLPLFVSSLLTANFAVSQEPQKKADSPTVISSNPDAANKLEDSISQKDTNQFLNKLPDNIAKPENKVEESEIKNPKVTKQSMQDILKDLPEEAKKALTEKTENQETEQPPNNPELPTEPGGAQPEPIEESTSLNAEVDSTITDSEGLSVPEDLAAKPIDEKPIDETPSLEGQIFIRAIKNRNHSIKRFLISNAGFKGATKIHIKSDFTWPVTYEMEIKLKNDPEDDKWIKEIGNFQRESLDGLFSSVFLGGNYTFIIETVSGKKFVIPYKSNTQKGVSYKNSYRFKIKRERFQKDCKNTLGVELNSLLREARWLQKAGKKSSRNREKWVGPVASRLAKYSTKIKQIANFTDLKTREMVLVVAKMRRPLVRETRRLTLPAYQDTRPLDFERWAIAFKGAKALLKEAPCSNEISFKREL